MKILTWIVRRIIDPWGKATLVRNCDPPFTPVLNFYSDFQQLHLGHTYFQVRGHLLSGLSFTSQAAKEHLKEEKQKAADEVKKKQKGKKSKVK